MSDPIGGLEFLGIKVLRKSDGSSGIGSLPNGRVDLTGDEDPTDEDGDIEIGWEIVQNVRGGKSILNIGIRWDDSRVRGRRHDCNNPGEITVVTLVKQQMSSWKGYGNLIDGKSISNEMSLYGSMMGGKVQNID
ncbi:hypothetical protein Tco_0943275 [Tanacetum coccineum]